MTKFMSALAAVALCSTYALALSSGPTLKSGFATSTLAGCSCAGCPCACCADGCCCTGAGCACDACACCGGEAQAKAAPKADACCAAKTCCASK